MKKKMNKKKSFIKTFFDSFEWFNDWISDWELDWQESLQDLLKIVNVIVLVAGFILCIFNNNKTVGLILVTIHIGCLFLSMLLYAIVEMIIPRIVAKFKLINRVRSLPVQIARFDELTRHMDLTECLFWLNSWIRNDDSLKYFEKYFYDENYAKDILQFYILAYNKYYNDTTCINTQIPSILTKKFAFVNWEDIDMKLPEYLQRISQTEDAEDALESLRLLLCKLYTEKK